jgi:hypothetical protein
VTAPSDDDGYEYADVWEFGKPEPVARVIVGRRRILDYGAMAWTAASESLKVDVADTLVLASQGTVRPFRGSHAPFWIEQRQLWERLRTRSGPPMASGLSANVDIR